MDPTALMDRTATLTRVVEAATRDEYNDVEHTETSSTVACWFHQRSMAEQTTFGQVAVGTAVFYLPAATVIGKADRLIFDGIVYEVVGEPKKAHNPRTGADSHIEAEVRSVT